jgi:hypothetical protein
VERVQLGQLLMPPRDLQGNREVMVLRDVLELDTAGSACLQRGSGPGPAAPGTPGGRRALTETF